MAAPDEAAGDGKDSGRLTPAAKGFAGYSKWRSCGGDSDLPAAGPSLHQDLGLLPAQRLQQMV